MARTTERSKRMNLMVDPARLHRECELVTNASAVVDEALTRLVDEEEIRRHVQSYLAEPDEDNATFGRLASATVDPSDAMRYETSHPSRRVIERWRHRSFAKPWPTRPAVVADEPPPRSCSR